MPEVWGLMPKAQDNNQKIDDAIAQAIANHESDSEAHLGEGEALQSHKASEIIDHRAGSIVADKMSGLEFNFQTTFENLSMWYSVGDVSQDTWPGVVLFALKNTTNYSKIQSDMLNLGVGFYSGRSFFWQAVLKFNRYTYLKSLFGPVGFSDSSADCGFYFQVDHGYIYAKYKIDSYTGSSAVVGIDPTVDHVYRIWYDGETNIVYYFVDGVQKVSFNLSHFTMGNDFFIGFLLSSYSASYACEMSISQMIFSGPIS